MSIISVLPQTRHSRAAHGAPRPAGNPLFDWLRVLGATVARVLLFTILGMMFWAAAPSALGWAPTTVLSDSMAPLIRAGDVVVSRAIAPASLRPGQILLADDPDHDGRLRLHRFVDVAPDGTIVTKGDANRTPDSTSVSPEAVHGVGYLRVPFAGLPVVWAHEQRWMLIAGCVFGVLLLMWASGADRSLRRRHEPLQPRRPRVAQPPSGALSPQRAGMRALASSASFVPVSLGLLLVACLVFSGGARAAFSSQTLNPSSTLATSSYPCLARTPANSPYLYLAYNEASGSSALDSSANGRTAVLTAGATRVAGSCLANASPVLALDGVTGQVTNPNLVTAPNVFTISTWFRTATTSGGKLLGFGNSVSGLSSVYGRHIYMTDAGRLVFGIYNLGLVYTATSTAAYNDGRSHHVAATLSGSGMALYVDGVRVATNIFTTAGEQHTGYWRIGYDNIAGWPSAPSSNYFAGELDDTAVWLIALSASQIAAEYTKGP
jgi:signal peptidase I